jgi:transposase
MSKRTRPTYSPEFRLEVAQEVVDNNRRVKEVSQSLGLGNSTVDKWVRQLKQERAGKLSSATPLTPDKLKIRELERKINRLEGDNQILKKATVDSIGHCNSSIKIQICRSTFDETNKTNIYTE